MIQNTNTATEPTRDTLHALREVQGITGPNWCFAAAKFYAGKLQGLFGRNKHLRDFFNSSWYRRHRRKNKVLYSWGSPIGPHPAYFNDHVIRPSVLLPEAGVNVGSPTRAPIQFDLFRSTAFAEQLLKKKIPVVAAVDLSHARTGGWGGQDHYVTLVMDSRQQVWIIDPWATSKAASVVRLPGNTLSRQVKVRTNANGRLVRGRKPSTTTIPPNRPYFGYFRVVQNGGVKMQISI